MEDVFTWSKISPTEGRLDRRVPDRALVPVHVLNPGDYLKRENQNRRLT